MEAASDSGFNYSEAFARNLGWVTPEEQRILQRARIAIAGLGGVGGSHLVTLTRLGIGAFSLADPDVFELVNFNRQAGATLASIGRAKVEVLSEMALGINSELNLRSFPAGVSEDNLPAFFENVDLYVDGLDFFAVDIRRKVFAYCHANGIPAITAAPLGMGAALLVFMPGAMSFEEYFRLEGLPRQEQLLRFIVGLSPSLLQRSYLVAPEAVDFEDERGPSTAMACELCAGVAATEALKILLGRGKVRTAPWGSQFDAYRSHHRVTWRPLGNANPLQWLILAIARRQLRQAQPGRRPR